MKAVYYDQIHNDLIIYDIDSSMIENSFGFERFTEPGFIKGAVAHGLIVFLGML